MTIRLLGGFKFQHKTLIGLAGAARSGKDTSGTILSKLLGYPTYALASPIKKVCNELHYWDDRHANGELKEVVDPFWGYSPRHAYQTMGTELARNLWREDFWLKRAEMVYQKEGSLIITDIRFQNEADFIRSNGGQIIHIVRDGAEKVLNHASEAGIDKHKEDVILYNNSTIEILEANLEGLVNFLTMTESPKAYDITGDKQ